MDFSILTPIEDRDIWATGIFLFVLWAWWLGTSLYFPYKKSKWLKKNPSFPDVVEHAFTAFSQGSFSTLGKLNYASWLLLSLCMIAMGYLKDNDAEVWMRFFMLTMIPVTLIVTGLHYYVNAYFLNIRPTVISAKKTGYDINSLRTVDHQDNWIYQAFGLVMIGASIFLLSCGFLGFPINLQTLATLLPK